MAELSSTSVKLVEVCRVAPKPQPDVVEFSLPLTFFDLLWLRFPQFHRLFFYEILASSASAATKPFFDSLLFQKLKASLSVILTFYRWQETSLGPKTPTNPFSVMSEATPFRSPQHSLMLISTVFQATISTLKPKNTILLYPNWQYLMKKLL